MTAIFGAQQGRFGRATLFDIREPVADHAHPHLHLLFKLEGGDRGLQVGEDRQVLEDGNCLLVRPWQRHSDIGALCTECSVILALYVDLEYLRGRYGSLAPHVTGPAMRKLSTAGREQVKRLAGLLEAGGDDQAVEDATVALVEDALSAPHEVDAPHAASSDYRIRRAMERLKEHPHLHPDLVRVASSVGLSRSRFFEQFKNSVGIAPTMFVDGLLIEEAITMLVFTHRSIEEISASLGFSAQSSFSRFFKDRVGFPPAALRQAAGALH